MTPTMNVAGMNAAEMMNLGAMTVIASIFPLDQSIERPFKTTHNGGFYTRYTLPAAKDRNTPSLIVIADALHHVYLGEKKWQDIPVPGGSTSIAEDFIRNTRDAAFNAKPGSCPGIWICKGMEPTADEIAQAIQWQTNYFTELSLNADNDWFNGRKENIGLGAHTIFRVGAKWLGLDPRNHEWMMDERKGEIRDCPFCGTSIAANVAKCVKCGEIVNPELYARLKSSLDARQKDLDQAQQKAAAAAPVPVPGKFVPAPVQHK